tara:strand:- start:4626 stop:5171 length:546 start_codon:yes stop_codon:yes gene_type:complete
MPKIQDLIAGLKSGDKKSIEELYLNNKKPFLLFAKRYQINSDELLDIYQDAVIALCENAKKGKLESLQVDISTYLFSIGKFMIYRRLKQLNRNVQMGEITLFHDWELEDEDEGKEQVQQLGIVFKKLGEQCQKVLRLFYYEEKKLDEIQQLLSYSSKDVLKAQKSRCLKQLKELIQKKNNG